MKVFDFDYRPTALIADAANAINNRFMLAFSYESIGDFTRVTCWAHVYIDVDKKLSSSMLSDLKNKCQQSNIKKSLYQLSKIKIATN